MPPTGRAPDLLQHPCISSPSRLRVKLPKQRALTAPSVIDALSDKASSVRRYAINTLTNMILTHPFGAMYGGFLNQPEWEARYQQVREQLKRLEAKQMGPLPVEDKPSASEVEEDEGDEELEEDEVAEELEVDDEDNPDAEDDDSPKKKSKKHVKKEWKQKRRASPSAQPHQQPQELDGEDMANFTRLKLTKRYIADALEFIRQVEGSMDILGQLLGSTSKAEVLESIDFFKVAHEYQMAGAAVR